MRPLLYTQNDEPVIDPWSGRRPLVEQVAREIAQCELPQVFGLHGDWGAGKTSFLCEVEHFITGDCQRLKLPEELRREAHSACEKVKVVWFEAWRYQHEPAPVIALLHEMCSQLGKVEQLISGAKRLFFTAFRSIINMVRKVEFEPKVGEVSLGKVEFSPVEGYREAGKAWEEEHMSAPLTTERIRALLDDTIKQLLGWTGPEDKARVLIIVDDLDRCTPSAAYRLLEGIKIYLSLKSCVFLLGVNQREIVRAIGEAKVGANLIASKQERKDYESEIAIRGAEYLEKLCGVIWKLPLPIVDRRAEMLREMLRPMRPVKDGGGKMELKDRNPLPARLVERIAALVVQHDCLAANPRKIKMFANALRHLACAGLPKDIDGWDLQEDEDLPVFACHEAAGRRRMAAAQAAAAGLDPKQEAAFLAELKNADSARPPEAVRIAENSLLDEHAAALVAAASIYAFHPKLLQYLQAHRSFFGELLQWAKTGALSGKMHDVLAEMELLHDKSVSSPTPSLGPDRFADPSYGAIFRVQRLINEEASPPDPFYDMLGLYLNLPPRGTVTFVESQTR